MFFLLPTIYSTVSRIYYNIYLSSISIMKILLFILLVKNLFQPLLTIVNKGTVVFYLMIFADVVLVAT